MVQPESLATITQEIRLEAAEKGLTLDILKDFMES
jgi:hypothetical protein